MNTNDKNGTVSFEKELLNASYVPDIACGIVMLIYSIFILNLDVKSHYLVIFGILILIVVFQFLVSPVINHMVMGKVSKKIQEYKLKGMNVEERTELFKMIHRMPMRKQLETATFFVGTAFILTAMYHFLYDMNFVLNMVNLFAMFLGSYVASLFALSYTRRICSKYACMLVEDGIDERILKERYAFGTSYQRSFIIYGAVPVVWSILLAMALFYVYYYNNISAGSGFLPAVYGEYGLKNSQFMRIGIVLLINMMIGILSVYSFFKGISTSSDKLQGSMRHIIKNDIFTVDLVATDFENEVSYNMYLVNQIVLLFRSILDDIRKIAKTMVMPIGELSEISQATASSSLEQSTGVKEILATMEDTDRQTRNIVEKIADVTDVAEGTEKNVNAGFETLQLNLDKMTEITEANVSTISGIRELGEKIGSIWEIVKIINDIADQTRIIAFNAELEASSAGNSGRNFHIVANEVRRLAAGITNSVEQIKDKITEIQHSSDNLIITSESGTEKIREGLELSEKLKEKFSDIQSSSEITVESANQIKEIIHQQSAAFDQIVATVRQISSGIENFSTSTSTVNNTAQNLKDAANLLENLHSTIVSATE
ncbi:MAG: hypothetical protein J5747_00185 [Spirochaetaceae bacterium]|nr:hypothetical protein [Spirochaetaceae bacterium]MBO4706242.1 hypothetical protein [Spirochaetaceae bacterium]